MYDTQPTAAPIMQPEVNAVDLPVQTSTAPAPQISAPTCNVVDVYVYPKDFQMVNDDKDNDCILVDIHFCVNAYERNGDDAMRNATSRSGVVKKRLLLSRAQLLNDLLRMDANTPITMVEAAIVDNEAKVEAEVAQIEAIKEEKTTSDVTKRMRELAGLPSKGNWV